MRGYEKKLEAAREEAKKLLDMAIEGTVSQGATFKARWRRWMGRYWSLRTRFRSFRQKKSVTQMSAYSGEFLHSNIRFAMQYLDEAPPDAQKSLLRTLIKEILVLRGQDRA